MPTGIVAITVLVAVSITDTSLPLFVRDVGVLRVSAAKKPNDDKGRDREHPRNAKVHGVLPNGGIGAFRQREKLISSIWIDIICSREVVGGSQKVSS